MTWLIVLSTSLSQAQIFEMMKPYTGSHYGFSYFDESGINQFVLDFNEMWKFDISSGFEQYKGTELGQVFSTSGTRFVWGKKDRKWTASTDYALGYGKQKNTVEFNNGMSQIFNLKATSNQISTTFGVALKENKVWLEGMYVTNLTRILIEYATIHQNGVESYGTEYKLNGLYKGTIKTMGLGFQASYRKGKYVFYTRMILPVVIVGPSKMERVFVDERNSQLEPNEFPSNYESYVNDPSGHISRGEQLNTENFKGFSYGFGMLRLFGKKYEDKKEEAQ